MPKFLIVTTIESCVEIVADDIESARDIADNNVIEIEASDYSSIDGNIHTINVDTEYSDIRDDPEQAADLAAEQARDVAADLRIDGKHNNI